jgi:L-fuculose-phosphate aldolase
MQNALEQQIKEQLCDIGRRIWQKGFCAGNEGNHSMRIGPDRYLCTPTNISKGNMTPDDICLVDGAGNQFSGRLKRTSEFLMHAAIYKARPDVTAVIHAHPPHATAFAIAGIDLPTGVHPEAEVFIGHVKTSKYVCPGDGRLAETILPHVHGSNTVLMAGHGVVCFDINLEQCYYKLEIVDSYARVLLLARQLGNINTFSPQEMRELLALKKRFGLHDPRMDTPGDEAVQSTAKSLVQPPSNPMALELAIRAMVPKSANAAKADAFVRSMVEQVTAGAKTLMTASA